MNVRIKEEYSLRQVAGTWVAIPAGNDKANDRGIITLNDTAAELWQLLIDGATVEEMIVRLGSEYDVDEASAQSGIRHFLDDLKSRDLIVEDPTADR